MSPFKPGVEPRIRNFVTGATRDVEANKLDYEAFFAPLVLERRAQYMQKHRKQADGSLRAGDNWQKGMPRAVYMSSLVRHVMDLWREWRSEKHVDLMAELLCAVMFNAEGLLLELLLEREAGDG